MRRSKTMERLRANELVRVCAMGHFIPAYVRHAAGAGFDCIWFDLEHRAMEAREIQSLLILAHLCDIDIVLRTGYREANTLYRVLEDGAAGIMAPMINTVEEAEALVRATKFPPLGNRGYDGAGLDSDYLYDGGHDYCDAANRETVLIAQIESIEAVHNAEAIAAVEGIDALFLGWGDLGLRVARSPDVSWTVDEAADMVAAAARAQGKHWGAVTMGDPAAMRKRYDAGARFLPCIGEFVVLKNALDELGAALEKEYGRAD